MSPVHSPSEYELYENMFNYTSTYKPDSDFPGFYEQDSQMIWQPNATFDETYDFSQGKSRMAAWVVGNCRASNTRMEYIHELQKHIAVDIYGPCGPLPCQTKPVHCKDIIAVTHRFYLSFENSICKDYITEKFFQMLKFNIIPVVYGGGNYSYYVSLFSFFYDSTSTICCFTIKKIYI